MISRQSLRSSSIRCPRRCRPVGQRHPRPPRPRPLFRCPPPFRRRQHTPRSPNYWHEVPSRELRGSAGRQERRISDGEAFASLSACGAAEAALCAVGSFVAATTRTPLAAFPLAVLAAAAVHLWSGPIGAAKRLAVGEKNVARAGEALGGRGRRRSGEHVRLIGIRVASKWHLEGVRLPNWRRHISLLIIGGIINLCWQG